METAGRRALKVTLTAAGAFLLALRHRPSLREPDRLSRQSMYRWPLPGAAL